MLAGLSPTWYTYLEQGRDIRPSPDVLDSLARVLQLTEDERRYLYLLANGQGPPVTPTEPDESDRVMMQRVVSLVGDVDFPVYAGNVYGDVTAWNPAAAEWYTDFGRLPAGRRNMLWWLLTAPEARERVVGWADDTRDVVARFRIASAGRPWDRRFGELTKLMLAVSPEFRVWWSDHDVSDERIRPRSVRLPGGRTATVQLVVLRMIDSFHSIIMHVPAGGHDEKLARSATETGIALA